jgi:hypothetical protein
MLKKLLLGAILGFVWGLVILAVFSRAFHGSAAIALLLAASVAVSTLLAWKFGDRFFAAANEWLGWFP